MVVNEMLTDRIHLTQERTYYESLDCSITFFGVTHKSDSLNDQLKDNLDNYEFDSVLYEEHIRNGFDAVNVPEHQAIERYAEEIDTNIRSMDIPENSKEIDSLAEVMSNLADSMIKIKNKELITEDGMIEFNGRYESEKPELYSFAHQLRNDKMSIEIIKEARRPKVDRIGVVVGKSHIFGSDSIVCKIETNLDKYF